MTKATRETVASELVLSGPEWFPIAGAQRPDPLRLVLGQLTDLGDGERVLVQVVARPATAREPPFAQMSQQLARSERGDRDGDESEYERQLMLQRVHERGDGVCRFLKRVVQEAHER